MTSARGQAIGDTLAYRYSSYDLLRRVFLWELPLELFADLIVAAKGESAGKISGDSPDAVLKNYFRGLSADDLPTTYRDLHIEYTRLFVGPQHLPAPPYESVYRSPEKLMMQDVTIDVRSIYARSGFQVRRLNQEPDDTIGLEMEFMCAMTKASMDALLKQDYRRLAELVTTQRDFHDLHLSQWVPQFCDDILNNSQTEFWKSIALFTRSFLEEDAAELDRLGTEVKALAESNADKP